MGFTTTPRVVVATRRTDYERVLVRHATHAQARFFLESRGQSIDTLARRHAEMEAALHMVLQALPVSWRRTRVDRADLDRFLFEPEDIVVAVGQDGLVANVAKYLSGQPVLGVNPSPAEYEGILVPHPPAAVADLLATVIAGRDRRQSRTMVEAELDDGLTLRALNEIFVGHRSHQSARYVISFRGGRERQSSSGVIVSSGTGSTGWALSIQRQRRAELALPTPTAPQLVFFVREAFPSVSTATTLTEGLVADGEGVEVTSEMDEGGCLFGDGIEDDRIEFGWGRRVTVRRATARLELVVP